MRIAIATVVVPFQRGGADIQTEELRRVLRELGHAVDVVSMPFRFFPETQVRRAMDLWETEDLTELNLTAPDLVLCEAFPTFYAKHPRKRTWLMHPYRPAYDLRKTAGVGLSEAFVADLRARDVAHLKECERRFTTSLNNSQRLRTYCGVDSQPVYHPPAFADRYYHAEGKPYIFAPSRIETL